MNKKINGGEETNLPRKVLNKLRRDSCLKEVELNCPLWQFTHGEQNYHPRKPPLSVGCVWRLPSKEDSVGREESL